MVGTFGLTGMIVAVNAALTALILARRRDDRGTCGGIELRRR